MSNRVHTIGLLMALVPVLPGGALAQPAVVGPATAPEKGAINGPGLTPKADAHIVRSGRTTAGQVRANTSGQPAPADPVNAVPNATPGCANGSTVGAPGPDISAATGSNGASDNSRGTGSGTTC